MNKMGLCQRFWCLFVSIVLMLTAAGIYPDFGSRPAQAQGIDSTGNPPSAIAGGNEIRTTGRAVLYSQERYSTGASSRLGGSSRSSRPAASQPPQPTAAPQARKNNGTGASKQPATLPVTAPAPEQIITTLKVTATGYTAGYESTGKTSKHPQYGITYSGVKVRRDKNSVSTIAADPKVLPLGSILYIPDYGYAVVADTGSAIKGRKIDLYFATTKQVYKEWGKKTVVVQLIKRGNGKCTESMLKNLGNAIQTYKSVPQDLLEEII